MPYPVYELQEEAWFSGIIFSGNKLKVKYIKWQ